MPLPRHGDSLPWRGGNAVFMNVYACSLIIFPNINLCHAGLPATQACREEVFSCQKGQKGKKDHRMLLDVLLLLLILHQER